MPGGTWNLENKIRPGAYVNFSAQSSWTDISPNNGIVAMAMDMSWGPEQEPFTVDRSAMKEDGFSEQLGYSLNHVNAIPLKEALTNCRRVIGYRLNSGGVKANAFLENLSVTAKYNGVRGNDIAVSVIANDDAFTVITYVDEKEINRQNVGETQTPVDNSWVTFTLEGVLTPVVVTKLAGGSNGTILDESYDAYFDAMKNKAWQVMTIPVNDSAVGEKLTAFIKKQRDESGKKVQGVVWNYPGDYEGIINVIQGYVRKNVTVVPYHFTSWVAGVTAAAEVQESNTYRVVQNADGIINEIDVDEVESKLRQGIFLLSRRTDGTVVVEQDINSLISFDHKKDEAFRKNRVLRTLDRIANGITAIFENNYIGVITNNDEGRDLFKQDIVGFMNGLMGLNAIEDFNGTEDVLIAQGTNVDSVVVSLGVCPVDAMEKLYITVEVIA